MSLSSSGEKPVRLFLYSTILPVVWIAFCYVANAFFMEAKAGVICAMLLLLGVVSLISWLFVRRHRRTFSKSEYWRIILYCFAWVLIMQSPGIFCIFKLFNSGGVMNETWFLPLILSAATIGDFLLVWLAFRQTGRRVVSLYLKSLEKKALAQKNVEL